MMDTIILDFPKQFRFDASIQNQDSLQSFQKFAVCGMGGSNHATDLLCMWQPGISVDAHRDYGLPELQDIKERLIICCSYSGNTEETLDSFQAARAAGLSVAVIAAGGQLLQLAKDAGVPYIQFPDDHIPPRSAVGYMVVSLLKLMGDDKDMQEVSALADQLKPDDIQAFGRELASALRNVVPVVYASHRNAALANNWKIKLNENAKIPSFMNVFPELNHNEMNGFEALPSTSNLTSPFSFVFLHDSDDDPRIRRRMEVVRKLYNDRGRSVYDVEMTGSSRLVKIFTSFLLADWVSIELAKIYEVDPAPVPMVEEFKKLIA